VTINRPELTDKWKKNDVIAQKVLITIDKRPLYIFWTVKQRSKCGRKLRQFKETMNSKNVIYYRISIA